MWPRLWYPARMSMGRSRRGMRAMKFWNGIATAALVGLTIALAPAGSSQAQQPPAAGTQPPAPPAPGGGRQGRGVFPQQQRPPGDPAAIERGRTLYSVTCSACHGVDARGGQLGEAIMPVILKGRPDKGMPPAQVTEADAKALATYLHYLLAAAGKQGSPPPTDTPPPDVLVGDASAGKTFFDAK